MKALILAAGFGLRLAPLTNDLPKSLVPVNGKPILVKQIENLRANHIEDITVISGYKAEIMESTIGAQFPGVKFIRSVDYATTNNMYSAFLAREAMGQSPFLMMNADVFFDESVITALLEDPSENAIVTEKGTYIEESMKVVEQNGRLTGIAKTVPAEEALGVSIDVYKFSPDGARAFFDKCAEYICEKKALKLWSEVALNDILSEVPFTACPLKGRWLEIDNMDDLAAAEKLFKD